MRLNNWLALDEMGLLTASAVGAAIASAVSRGRALMPSRDTSILTANLGALP